MTESYEHFADRWRQSGESSAAHAVDTAWRRYQQIQDASYRTEPETDDPTAAAFESDLGSFLSHLTIAGSVQEHRFTTLPANTIPWTATGLHLTEGQQISTFATGRVWRSRDLDLWLRPQFALWFKVGIQGAVFNSTGRTNTFRPGRAGELYLANQYPGQFGEPQGGRVAGQLEAYDKADGNFEILVVVWKDGVDVQHVLNGFATGASVGSATLIRDELRRIERNSQMDPGPEWSLLWFLGRSSIYSLREHESQPCMHCKPYQNVGILQKQFDPTIAFRPGTRVSWDWMVSCLPSRLREDLTFTHDYLSLAFEFENGRDLTYTWSWELPKDFGYWCPLPSWKDREYHVVIRTGTAELGSWLSEERDLYADYKHYIEEDRDDRVKIPKQIVRFWFIAGNRWQRYDGEMMAKRVRIANDDMLVEVL